MYRIITVHRTTRKQICSPFVFTKDQAVDQCNLVNAVFSAALHIPVKAESWSAEEVYQPEWGLYDVLERTAKGV